MITGTYDYLLRGVILARLTGTSRLAITNHDWRVSVSGLHCETCENLASKLVDSPMITGTYDYLLYACARVAAWAWLSRSDLPEWNV